MKYVSIPAKKCLAQRKNSSLPVTLGVGRIHPRENTPSGRAVPEILRSRCSMKLPKPIKRIISEVPGLDIQSGHLGNDPLYWLGKLHGTPRTQNLRHSPAGRSIFPRVYSSNSQCDRQRGIFALSKTFFRRNTDVFQGKMAQRSVKRPAVRVRWELEEYTLGSSD